VKFRFDVPGRPPFTVDANTLKQARRKFARLCGYANWAELPAPMRKRLTVTTGPEAYSCRDTR